MFLVGARKLAPFIFPYCLISLAYFGLVFRYSRLDLLHLEDPVLLFRHDGPCKFKVSHNNLFRIRHAHFRCSIAAVPIVFRKIFKYKLVQVLPMNKLTSFDVKNRCHGNGK